MAKINNTAAYATATPTADSIVIGSIASGDATNNFLMSDIAVFVMGANTLTLQDVCDNGTTTSTGMTVGGAVTMSAGATINGSGLAVNGSGGILVTDVAGITSAGGPVSGTALSTSGGLFVSGTSILGEIDSAGPADIADTLTLSLASGTGLQVDADANIDGNLTIALGSALYTDEIRTTSPVSNLSFYTGGFLRGSFTALGTLTLSGGLNVQNGGALMNQGLTVNNLAQFNDDVLLGGSVPSSSTDTGVVGQIAVDATYIYVCVGTNSWGRVAIDTTPF